MVAPPINTAMKKHSRGFTLLLAAIISSIVLSLGVSIYQIVSKELALSSLGRDSQLAFYAADTGAECALFWDVRFGYFATSAPATVVAPDPRCDGQSVAVPDASRPAGPVYYPYTLSFTFAPGGYCTDVRVTKTFDVPSNTLSTTIHADGLSTDCASRSTNTHTLQRSVELHY